MGIGLAVAGTILAGAASAASNAYEAHKQEKLAEKQQKEQERLAKLEAGKAPTNTINADEINNTNANKRSAIRQTILSRQQSSGSKLGD